jgi:hypothetical protein
MASMNAGIILGGQSPNLLATVAGANQAAAQQNQFQQRNELAQFNRQNGAAVAAGDQSALNQFANLAGPQASLGIQQQQQSMASAQATQGRLSRQEERQIQSHAASMSAQERAAEAAQMERGVAMAMGARSPEEFDAIVTQFDPSLAGQFGNRDALAARFMSMADLIKRADGRDVQPEWRVATPEEAAQNGAVAGQVNTKTGKFDAQNPPSGMSITSDGDGGFSMTQGSGVGGSTPKLTVDAAKNTGFLVRTREANEVLNSLEGEGTKFGQQSLGDVPLGLGNFARTEDFQKYDQARRNFVNAILRRESGAVIADSEFDNADKQYFPMPGDGPQVIAQKRQNRIAAIRGLEIGSGAGAGLVAEQPQPEAAPAGDFEFTNDAQKSVFEKYSQP